MHILQANNEKQQSLFSIMINFINFLCEFIEKETESQGVICTFQCKLFINSGNIPLFYCGYCLSKLA